MRESRKCSQTPLARRQSARQSAPIAAGPKEFASAFDFLAKGKNEVRFCDEDVAFLREALDGLPPNLALFDTPLGSLRGKNCNL